MEIRILLKFYFKGFGKPKKKKNKTATISSSYNIFIYSVEVVLNARVFHIIKKEPEIGEEQKIKTNSRFSVMFLTRSSTDRRLGTEQHNVKS